MTLIEAAQKLRTTPGAARGVLDRLKVKPFNLGRGRGLGLRWKSEEKKEYLNELHMMQNGATYQDIQLQKAAETVGQNGREDQFDTGESVVIKNPRHF